MIEIIAAKLAQVEDEPEDDLGFLKPKTPPPPRGEPTPRPGTPEEVRMADEDEDVDLAPAGERPSPVAPAFEPAPAAPAEPAPVDPGVEYEEVVPEEQPDPYANLDIRGKIFSAMTEGLPLRITYTSLAGYTTERSVLPDYVYWAGTNRHVMVAWCYLRNDWRAFVVDRISVADIEKKEGS